MATDHKGVACDGTSVHIVTLVVSDEYAAILLEQPHKFRRRHGHASFA